MDAFAAFWAASVAEEGRRALPLLLWREFSATHFTGLGDGTFDRIASWSDAPCSAVEPAAAAAGDFRNRVALPRVQAVGAGVLRTFGASLRLGPDFHPQFKGVDHTDCLHWCHGPGSLPELWNGLLLQALRPREVFEGAGGGGDERAEE